MVVVEVVVVGGLLEVVVRIGVSATGTVSFELDSVLLPDVGRPEIKLKISYLIPPQGKTCRQ